MDPLVASSLISTGSNLIGGLLGGDDGPGPTELANIQYKVWKKQIAHEIPARVKAAKSAGIHPLVALGASPVSGPSISVGGDSGSSNRMGDALSGLGQGISRAVEAYASKEERDMSRAAAKLSLENQQLQNDRLRSEIALLRQPGSPPGMADNPIIPGQSDSIKHIPQSFYDTIPTGLGTSRNVPLHTMSIDEKGRPMRVWNEDLGDNEILQALHSIGYSLPDWVYTRITKPAAKKLRRFIKNVRGTYRGR